MLNVRDISKTYVANRTNTTAPSWIFVHTPRSGLFRFQFAGVGCHSSKLYGSHSKINCTFMTPVVPTKRCRRSQSITEVECDVVEYVEAESNGVGSRFCNKAAVLEGSCEVSTPNIAARAAVPSWVGLLNGLAAHANGGSTKGQRVRGGPAAATAPGGARSPDAARHPGTQPAGSGHRGDPYQCPAGSRRMVVHGGKTMLHRTVEMVQRRG